MVTADMRALVCVWDIINGEKVMEFNANPSSDHTELEVTAMTFDTTYRRLLTTLNDGSLAIWNFNNANCLRQVVIEEEEEEEDICLAQAVRHTIIQMTK